MVSSNSSVTCYVDRVGTDPDGRTYLHLRYGNNSIWCELKNIHKYNKIGKKTKLYQKSISKDRFIVGKLIGVHGKYPMRTVTIDSGFGITYLFDELLHSDINFTD